MGRIVVHENVSVDGVMQDPTGEEGYASGGWFTRMPQEVFAAWGEVEYQEARECAAWFIGRGTYQWFAERWAAREGAWGDRLREVPKYVLSATLADAPEWANSFVVKGDPVAEAKRLRDEVDGDVLVYGSRPLAQALLAHGMVDELRLMTHPYVLGAGGTRLFPEQGAMRELRLTGVREVGGHLALLTYRPL
ncbi:dihydrofolate reductase family protein [Streptomyces sp. NPDC021020]|uniref:dihydrofolate reductase family protein n=1 Tax=Streptomyces sp. NPDC021020 TaxID=3365109 RepID=UPI00379A48C7